MNKLATNVGGAVGSRYLKSHNQLAFVEYAGFISTINLAPAAATIVSQGTVVIKGTYTFDCEDGSITETTTSDLFWEQYTNIARSMAPQNTAKIVNLGVVDFTQVTPATLPMYNYSAAPIVGNNDATNKLVVNDVFCVQTRLGNYCKLKVISYGYDLKVQYVTYKLNPAYIRIGSGYNQPEDIAVLANESTAYVTERAGNLLRVTLSNANRAAATVVCTGLNAPQQLWVDEVHGQAYTVEYGSAGRLVKIDLASGNKTYLYTGLNNAVGLIVSSDLSYAYISEQGISGISRINLTTGTRSVIATGLTNPFFLTWADENESALLVPERDPADRISMVDISKTSGNVSQFITGAATQPSSITEINPGTYCVCCNSEVDEYYIIISTGLYMGVGNVPWNLITAAGKADTTTQPAYSWQFPKNSPFGGTLPIMVYLSFAYGSGIRYYKVNVDGVPRHDTWTDLRMDPMTGYFDIPVQFQTDANGYYQIQSPVYVFYHMNLGCLLDSATLTNGAHALSVQFFDVNHNLVSSLGNNLFIDNKNCVASLQMPNINGHYADVDCGYLQYTNLTDIVTINFTASEAMANANYYFNGIRGAGNIAIPSQSGALPATGVFNGISQNTVQSMFGAVCAVKGIAAFAISLYVASTVINGVGRQSQYDASKTYAFCLSK